MVLRQPNFKIKAGFIAKSNSIALLLLSSGGGRAWASFYIIVFIMLTLENSSEG